MVILLQKEISPPPSPSFAGIAVIVREAVSHFLQNKQVIEYTVGMLTDLIVRKQVRVKTEM